MIINLKRIIIKVMINTKNIIFYPGLFMENLKGCSSFEFSMHNPGLLMMSSKLLRMAIEQFT